MVLHRKLTEDQLAAKEKKAAEWARFVEESEKLSRMILKPGSDERKQHNTIAEIIAGASQFISAFHVNGALVNKRDQLLRTSARTSFDDETHDDGAPLQEVLDASYEVFSKRIREMQGASEQDRAEFAWSVHHTYMVLDPFLEGSSRTARLMLNHTRLMLGLDLIVVEYVNRKEYFRLVKTFRQERYRDFVGEIMRDYALIRENGLAILPAKKAA